MKITIQKLKLKDINKRKDMEQIITYTDFSDVKDRGEIAHFIAEIDNVKLDLLRLWRRFNKEK